jgi:hypothetical protein
LHTCRLKDVEVDARCGVLRRPLDPARPQGVQIDLHVAVLPAIARRRLPDPVVFIAGGPGQSAISLAGPVSQLMTRELNRRDVILVDQRGTGQSAPLRCDDDKPTRTLAESMDPAAEQRALQACRARLQKLPYGDLRQFTTPIAMADLDAVRQALGVARWNVVGGSYGTRAALEYRASSPPMCGAWCWTAWRRPTWCCRRVSPPVRRPRWTRCSTTAPRTAAAARPTRTPGPVAGPAGQPAAQDHGGPPFTGQPETFTLTRAMLASLVLPPLYAPLTASALPLAVLQASQGRFEALVGLGLGAMGGGRGLGLATGMHFSVICAEDVPRMKPGGEATLTDFGDFQERLYRESCRDWPRGGAAACLLHRAAGALAGAAAVRRGGPGHAAGPCRARGQGPGAEGRAHRGAAQRPWRDEPGLHARRGVPLPGRARRCQGPGRGGADAACAAKVPRPPALLPLMSPTAASAPQGGAR